MEKFVITCDLCGKEMILSGELFSSYTIIEHKRTILMRDNVCAICMINIIRASSTKNEVKK